MYRNYDGLNRLTGIGENVFLDDSPSNGEQFNTANADYYLTINVYDTISSAIVNSLFTAPPDYTSPVYSNGNLVSTAYRTRFSDTWNFKYYKYDVRGRVIKMWNIISGFDTLITDYTYNSQDQVTDYSHLGDNEKISFRNTYDYTGRLSSVDKYDIPDVPNPDFINLAEYNYTKNSQLNEFIFGGFSRNHYLYDSRGRIFNFQNNDGMFEYTNEYFLNGNVKSQEFSGSYKDNFTNTSALNLNYTYDLSNRLLETENDNTQHKDDFKLGNAYDKDGNITELRRYSGSGSIMDNFYYSYYSGTNKLQKVSGSTTQYTYDSNGNMITDEVNRNRDIKYDHRNLITQIRNKKIVYEDSLVYVTYYFYDEAGNRIRKNVFLYIGLQPSDSVETPDIGDVGDMTSYWDLIKDEVYSRDLSGKEVALYVNGNLMQNNIWGLGNEGYITSSGALNFYLKDHLGSIRAVIDENNSVISGQDYDAWGYLLQNREYHSDGSVYKFTGKERDPESKYDYFGARYYDSRIGRWGTTDPLMEKHFDFSPYNYVLDNPLIFYDPDGRDPYRKFLGSKEQVMKVIEQNKGKTYYELSNVFDESTVRYIYTEKGGFIDLKHFFSAAAVSTKFSIQKAIILGEALEHGQFMIGNESANDPEDRPSNLEGARFGNNTNESDVYINFNDYLDEQNIIDPSDPSISSEKIYIPYDENDVPLPARASYRPYRGEPLKNDDIKGIGKY